MQKSTADRLLQEALHAAGELDDPSAFWVLSHLAGISSMSLSDDVPTACIIRSGERYQIKFGTEFARKYLHSGKDVLFVLLHEIMHKLNGDFVRQLEGNSLLDRHVANIAEDIFINAELCRRFFPQGIPLLEKLYNHRRFPETLLLPPASYFRKVRPDEKLNPAVFQEWDNAIGLIEFWEPLLFPFFQEVEGAPPPESVLDFEGNPFRDQAVMIFHHYFDGWFMSPLRHLPLSHYFLHLRSLFPVAVEVLLLGDHEHRDGEIPPWAEGFSETGGFSEFSETGGFSETEEEENIPLETPWRQVGRVAVLLRRMLEPDPLNPREAPLLLPERGLLPWPGRRECLWLAAGFWPVFFNAPVMVRDLDYLRPHLYIDVSASTSEHQPKIFGLVTHLADLIGEPIFLFSNIVVEASLEDIFNGKVRTTGGTDFDCVIEHAAKKRFKKIIIITDGCAQMNTKNQALVASGEIKVLALLTEDNLQYSLALRDFEVVVI